MSAVEQDVEIGPPAEDVPADPIERDRWIGWRLRRIAHAKAQMEQNDAVARAEIERYRNWVETENATLTRSIEWLQEQVRMAALTYPFNGKKSRKLAEGTFGFRAAGGRMTITDMEAALAFAAEHGIPIKVVTTVGVTDLKQYVESTGAELPFVEVEPKVDQFYVKVES